MIIHKQVDLQELSTFGLKASAKYLLEFDSHDDLSEVSGFVEDVQLPSMTIGGGSNLIFCSDYPGVVIKNTSSDISRHGPQKVTVSSGVVWDDFVVWSISQGLCGLEALSGIPGTVGGAVALNAGAYGTTVKDSLFSVVLYDIYKRKLYSLTTSELHYGHRSSIFRENRGNNIIIVDATFLLHEKLYLPNHPKINELPYDQRSSPSLLRKSILGLRGHMPSVATNHYSGSFFLNPIIPNKLAGQIRVKFPSILMRPFDGRHQQVASGWLLEQSGLRSTRSNKFYFHENHANFVMNESSGATGKDLSDFIMSTQEIVYSKFGIQIVPEPLLVGEEFWRGNVFHQPK